MRDGYGFLERLVCDPSSSCHSESTDQCIGSIGWDYCIEFIEFDGCKYCIDVCKNYTSAKSNYDTQSWESIGATAGAIGYGLVAGGLAFGLGYLLRNKLNKYQKTSDEEKFEVDNISKNTALDSSNLVRQAACQKISSCLSYLNPCRLFTPKKIEQLNECKNQERQSRILETHRGQVFT
jgi:hypothetical protein